jgi:hypothetical protein
MYMIARLTALILTLCIGLPMCWCSVGVPQREAVASCCAMKQHEGPEQSPAHSKDQNCPCAKHEGKRDVAATYVKAPVPVLKMLAEPVWSASLLANLVPSAVEIQAPHHDQGPPLQAAPLYARHCALLI